MSYPNLRITTPLVRQAIILAAGRGERLRPLTDSRPKPLIELAGRPLIDHHLDRLRQAGVTDCVVNIAYLGALIAEHVGDGTRYGLRIRLSKEPEGALETGGGIRQALALLAPGPFITVNADIFCDFDFLTLPVTPRGLSHLVLIDNPPHHPAGDFSFEGDLVGNLLYPRFTFSGIAVHSPQLFPVTVENPRFPLAPLLRKAAANGLVTGQIHRGQWFDIGTLRRLEEARTAMATS